MLNWQTIGETIEINGQKLLKCSNYSPIINYMCRKGRAYLKYEFLFNFIKNLQKKKICWLWNLFLTHILSSEIVREWIPSKKIFNLYRDSNVCEVCRSLRSRWLRIWTPMHLDQNSGIQNDRQKCKFWLYYYFILSNFQLYYYIISTLLSNMCLLVMINNEVN